MNAARLLVFVALASAGAAGACHAAIDGRVLWIIDGDTYQISHKDAQQGEPVRARHFDTPEKGSRARCIAERTKAAQATSAARRLLPRGTALRLSNLARDRYGRLLATITLADGTDLAAWFIGAGLALPYEGGRKPSWCLGFDDHGLRGVPPLARQRASVGLTPAVRGRDAPKIRKRIASRPPGFRSYPARPLTHDFATPDPTTRKRSTAYSEDRT